MEQKTGWVACDYSEGDRLEDVNHSNFFATYKEAMEWNEGWRFVHGDDLVYEGIRWVGEDERLYVDRPEGEGG